METLEKQIQWAFRDGFVPVSRVIGAADLVRDGGNVWSRGNGRWVSDRGADAIQALVAALSPPQVIASTFGGTTSGGNIVQHSATYWWISPTTGLAYVSNSLLGTSSTTLSLLVGGSPVAAGLSAPGAATIDAGGAATAKGFRGSYSIRIGAYRSTTGAYSNAGPVSNVIATNGNKMRITSWPSTVTGQTHYVVYGSQRGFGSIGYWFFYILVPNASATANYELEWYDGELDRERPAPIDYDPPPAGTHCAALADVMIVLTATGGVYPSIPGKPEAFPPGFVTHLASREQVTGCTSRGFDGAVFVSTANSLSTLISVNSEVTPIIPRGVWSDTGFAHGNAWAIVEDQIYGASGNRGWVRTHGDEVPDTSFADPVMDYAAGLGATGANTYVCSAPDQQAVFYAFGTRCFPYMRTKGEQWVWSTPITLPGTVTGALNLGGKGLLQIGTALYQLDQAGAGGNWFLQSPYVAENFRRKTVRYFKPSAGANLTYDILDRQTGSSIGSPFPVTVSGSPVSRATRCANRNIEAMALKVSGTTGGNVFDGSELTYLEEPLVA